MVAGVVLRLVLALAVLEVRRLQVDRRAVRPGPFAMRADIVDPHHHRVRHLPGPRRPALAADVADDDRAVADLHLGAVILADLNPLDEPEGAVSHATASRTSG